MNTNSKNKIHIFGTGDLSKEFASFANFDDDITTFYSKEDDLRLDINALINEENKVYIAITDSKARNKLFNTFIENGLIPDTYIHSTVIIGKRTSIGVGCIIEPNVIISNDVVIEDSVFINCNTNIGHNSKIGKYSSIMASVTIGGHCCISNLVYIGSGAIIMPKVTIAPNLLIGAGSVVIKNLKKQGSYFGNPAKLIW